MTLAYAARRAPRRDRSSEATALVGGKAANLGVMARDLGLPVPPGFVITTETCRDVPRRAAGRPASTTSSATRMAEVEAAVGRRFGDPADPLLVSVRSGAPVSMPGMMDTILDLGLNDATTAGLATCRRRRGVRPSVPRALRGELPRRSSASPTSRTTRGASCASRSRRCSGRGTATAHAPTARRRASPTTSGRR